METKVRIEALSKFLGVEESEIIESTYSEYTFEVNGEEYRVLTDSEADDAQEEYLDSYIDECILDQLPDNLRNYFDDEAFKRDCKYDGRGVSIASYDHKENEHKWKDENGDTQVLFIYRIN